MNGKHRAETNQLTVLWRRKWTVVIALLICVIGAEVVTKGVLTKVYDATATLLVSQSGPQTYETVLANEEYARSYAQILASPNFASQTAQQVGHGVTGDIVSSATTIIGVINTQLLTITASSSDPTRAQQIANAYANVAVQFAAQESSQTKPGVTLSAPAPLPTSPSRPQPVLYGLVAALLGLVLGVGIAFLRERFDVRINSAADLATLFDFPILADIPIRTSDPNSIGRFTEAFRLLRTNLRLIDHAGEGGPRTIAVTSWSEGEGKTTVSSQLAFALKSSGLNTVVVDGDTYRPKLQALLAGASGPRAPGLSDYLLGDVSAEQVVRHTKVAGLVMIPPGQEVPGLSSILDTPSGGNALAGLEVLGDAMVIDCPPLAVGADAPAIASRVDGVILVIDLPSATTTAINAAIDRLGAVNATLLGFVLNRNKDAGADYYGYYAGANGRPARTLTGRLRQAIGGGRPAR